MRIRDLAVLIGGVVQGDPDVEVTGVGEPGTAVAGQIVLAVDAEVLRTAEAGPASAVLVPDTLAPKAKPAIKASNVRLAFALLLQRFAPPLPRPRAVHPTAVLGRGVRLGEGVGLGPHVTLGDDVEVGPGTAVLAGAAVGDRVRIGADCLIHPHAVIRDDCVVGDRVIIHGGAVIGSDGFGFAEGPEGPVKIPQIGHVVIEDDVEIGANTTIDRATLGETRIGRGTKIDNQVQVGHNTRIGRGVIIAGQVGISGTVTIGDAAILAGRAGSADHVRLGAGVRLLALSVATKDAPPGAVLSGFPAQPHAEELRAQAAVRRLPQLRELVARLERRITDLERRLAGRDRGASRGRGG